MKATLLALLSILAFAGCQTTGPSTAPPERDRPQSNTASQDSEKPAETYVFSWGKLSAEVAEPRGGTTRGTAVTLAPPRSLPLPKIAAAENAFERDRAAILSLAGDYKTSFHFLETLGLFPEHEPVRPYHSWTTEQVRVLEDRGDFISLQHTLVMYFRQNDGSVMGPMVMKHWRQDWSYQDTDLHTYRGSGTWAHEIASPNSVEGAWSQAVWQVDDSPRYEAIGRWSHEGNRSAWASETIWRPLPRREYTARDDYDVMEGIHRIIITPAGWVHEQDNWKRVSGEATSPPEYRAREIGVDRYELITDPSLAAADEYWKETGPYWSAVRRAWQEIHAAKDRFTLKSKVDGRSQFEHHFEYASQLSDGQPWDPEAGAAHARATIQAYLTTETADASY